MLGQVVACMTTVVTVGDDDGVCGAADDGHDDARELEMNMTPRSPAAHVPFGTDFYLAICWRHNLCIWRHVLA